MSQQVADTLAGVSIGAAGWTWVAQANEILTLVATVVAIIAGLVAIRFHWIKAEAIRKEDDPG